MPRKSLPLAPSSAPPDRAEEGDEPLASRIATALHKIGLAMKQQSWQQASEEGLSATQGQILAALVPGTPLTGTELGQRLGLTLPTISDSVRVLLEKGLAQKRPDPRHPRASLIELTALGKRLGTRARAWPEFLADAVGALGAAEQATFFASLVKMIRALQEGGQVPVSGMCVTCTHFRPNAHAGARPHHCALVDAPLGGEGLRLDCPEHVRGSALERGQAWERFLGGPE
jgi:DNA-binding MarR family transcriptional regulator